MAWRYLSELIGEVVVHAYALLFLLLWLPEGLALWFRKRGQKAESEKNKEKPSFLLPPQTLGDQSLGRHLYAKLQVRIFNYVGGEIILLVIQKPLQRPVE